MKSTATAHPPKKTYSLKETSIDSPSSPNSDGAPQAFITERSRWKNSPWRRQEATWDPTIFQTRPFIGIIALCVAIGGALTSLLILVLSDNQAVSRWPVSPTVYLAVGTAITNASLVVARIEAIPVSWWYGLTKGKSIRDLERQWQSSRSVVQAIANTRHISLVGIACVVGALVVLDGPLLQRASTVVPGSQTSKVALAIKLTPELPNGFSGPVSHEAINETPAAIHLLPEYARNKQMKLDIAPSCAKGATCRTTVLGPGVAKRDCTTRTWPVTQEMMKDPKAQWGPWKTHVVDSFGNPELRLPLFYVSVTPNYDQPTGEAADLLIGLLYLSDFKGEFVETHCYLLPAIVEYDVDIVEGNIISLRKDSQEGRVVALANNTHAIKGSPAATDRIQWDTIDTVTVGVGIFVAANASCVMIPGVSHNWNFDPTTYNKEVFQHLNVTAECECTLRFDDPTPGVMSRFNEVLFRAATLASTNYPGLNQSSIDPGVSFHQNVAASQETSENVFHSDLRWFVGAAVIEMTAVLLILPLFWGWWTVGYNLTMSPFAIALAFDSPLLKDVNSATGTRGVVDKLGDMKLKLGAIHASDESTAPDHSITNIRIIQGRLGVAESHSVETPRNGTQFSE